MKSRYPRHVNSIRCARGFTERQADLESSCCDDSKDSALRILAITNLYPNPWQPGRAPFNRQLFRALAKRRDLRVIAPIAWTDEVSARLKNANGLPSSRQMICDGIKVDHPRYLFPPKILRGSYGLCFLESVRRTFEQTMAEFRPDIIYGSWAYPDGWAAIELGRRAGLPVVIRVHGSDINLLDQHPDRKRGTCEALWSADAVIAPSADLAKRVIGLGVIAARTHVVINGVDAGLFHFGARSEALGRLRLASAPPIILFVGNLIPIKGVDTLINACGKLAADKIAFSCYVVGQGPLKSHLDHQIRAAELIDRVKLLGPKPHNQLPDWYRAANVLVLPSHSEGMPNVLLEAAACGTRFIASNVGGIPELVQGRNGRLVPPADIEALAQAIKEELASSDIPRSHASSQPRSFDDSAAEIERILRGVVESHAEQKVASSEAMLPIEST